MERGRGRARKTGLRRPARFSGRRGPGARDGSMRHQRAQLALAHPVAFHQKPDDGVRQHLVQRELPAQGFRQCAADGHGGNLSSSSCVRTWQPATGVPRRGFPSGGLASGRTVIRYLRSIRNWNMGTPRRNGKASPTKTTVSGPKSFRPVRCLSNPSWPIYSGHPRLCRDATAALLSPTPLRGEGRVRGCCSD